MTGPTRMPARAIIFDMDGVLTHSSDIHRRAYESVLVPLGVPAFEYPRYAGMRTRDCIALVLREAGIEASDEQVSAYASEKSRRALALLTAENPVAPAVGETLRALGARFTLALASSGSRASVDLFLDANGLREHFAVVLCGSDVTMAKPDPEIYRRACESLGMIPGDCVVVEDAASGIAAAQAADMRVVAVTSTESRGRLAGLGPAAIVDTLPELVSLFEPAPGDTRSEWTALIPAAGRGTRLGFSKPKILYPVAGRTILEWLLLALRPSCGHFVFVLSPDGCDAVRSELEQLIPGRFTIAIQAEPRGMGDAVSSGLGVVSTQNLVIVWGDQVALKPESISSCIAEFDRAGAGAALPTVWRPEPYIHFERDHAGAITRVLQRREGDAMPPEGESDTGLFLFRRATLERLMGALRKSGSDRGAMTGEANFLPIFALFSDSPDLLVCPRVMSLEETVGINSPSDAAALGPVLRERLPPRVP